jgi:predicted metal-dependent hydrolase
LKIGAKHKNHSKKFWAEMDKYVGDGKGLRREIKKYRIGRQKL